MIRVTAFTGGEHVPSARFRVRQFLPRLQAVGIAVQEFHGRTSSYPPAQRSRRPQWAAARLAELVPACIRSRRSDAVLLQREMMSTLSSLERWTGRPRLLDVDDSIHLLRGGRAAKRLAALSDRVICGNDHLADVYSAWHRDVVVLPTAVDTARFVPAVDIARREQLVLGWIGTSGNHPYLLQVEDAIARAFSGFDAVLRVVSDSPPPFRHLDASRVQFAQWSAAREVREIQGFDIGLMPLQDTEWARGKCSFKLLQYMACGKPVVAAPVGMNHQVLSHSEVGLAATTDVEWIQAIRTLVEDEVLRNGMGARGRDVVQAHYSLDALAPRLAQHIRDIAGRHA